MVKATAADLGWTPLVRCLIAGQLLILLVTWALITGLHLSIEGWSAAAPAAVLVSICGGVWLYFRCVPGKSGTGECRVAEALLVLALASSLSLIAVVAQYPAVALGLPYADSWLARADAAVGINVAELARWTAMHLTTARLLTICYNSFGLQFLLTIFGLAIMGDRKRLWEFAFHYHGTSIVTLLALAVFPAVCPPAYYGFAPTIEMSHLIGQIRGFHDGTMTRIPLGQLEGLVSIPSFHVVGALAVTWAWRAHAKVLVPLIALNLLMIASTFVTGVHYFIDVLAGGLLFVGSVAAYRRYGSSYLPLRDHQHTELKRAA